VSRFQFGVPLGIDAARTRRDTIHLFVKGREVGTSARTPIELEPGGGELLIQKKAHAVEIGDFPLKGDIFAPGVLSASDDFRTGDQVAAHAHGELRAVGMAVMTPKEMAEMERGTAIKVSIRAMPSSQQDG
jgi:predicted RNA-binding protein (TIGR00451 family)